MAANGFPILLLLHLILESFSAYLYGSHSLMSVENQVMENIKFFFFLVFSSDPIYFHPAKMTTPILYTIHL